MDANTSFDPLAEFNRQRWNELAEAGIEFSRPMLDLDPAAARRFLDPYGVMGDVSGTRVLCLAGGGGQQSIAFTVLGAQATVCAGGRYDGLIAQLGGKPAPACGFALGIERLIELIEQQRTPVPENVPDIYLASHGAGATAWAWGAISIPSGSGRPRSRMPSRPS